MTASWAPNHAVSRSIDVVAVMARPTWAINHTAPDATQRDASENTAPTPALNPAPAAPPTAPDTVRHAVPMTGTAPGQSANASSTVSAPPARRGRRS